MAVNTLYGPATDDQNRFQIAGDPRVMYPVSAAGSMFDMSHPPHRIVAGSVLNSSFSGGARNMLTNGEVLASYGQPNASIGQLNPAAIRLGVTGASGGNVLSTLNEWGRVYATQRLDAGVHYTYFVNGEAVYQDTNATAGTYGASSEAFTITGTTVTTTNASTTVTASGNAFGAGDAILPVATYAAYTPSINQVRAGDVIRIQDGGSWYYHRIKSVTSRTVVEIYPAWAGGSGGGKTYQLIRTGYGSYSNIVSIYNSANGLFYNYYAGLHYSTALPGTIQCFTREASGAAASTHFTCPQTTGGVQDIQAVDIAYYKNYLLYGYGGAISWSMAGFPTSFTTGFGAADFPSANVTVVANDDQFVAFEYVGEQLIALFQHSLWEIQATGTVPEFNFYRIPEPVGTVLTAITGVQTTGFRYRRPSVSARNSVYYHTHIGLQRLSGRGTETVSGQVRAYFPNLEDGIGNPGLSWEPSTNSVWCMVAPSTGSGGSNDSDLAYVYSEEPDAWSVYDPANGTWASTGKIIRGSSPVQIGVDGFSIFYYDGTGEKVRQLDTSAGAPFALSTGNTNWEWLSPVISMSDQYGIFPLAGFQVDGFFTSTATYDQLGGKTPYTMAVVKSGTLSESDNRSLLGIKRNDAFIQFRLRDTSYASIAGLNIYSKGRGK